MWAHLVYSVVQPQQKQWAIGLFVTWIFEKERNSETIVMMVCFILGIIQINYNKNIDMLEVLLNLLHPPQCASPENKKKYRKREEN